MRALVLLSMVSALLPAVSQASVDRDLLALVPAEAQSVASLDVARAQASPFGQFVLSRMHDDEKFSEFIDRTGFDPRKDLQHVLVVSPGPGQAQNRPTVFARGIFDVDRLQSAALTKGSSVERYSSWNLIVNRSHNQNPTALVFPQGDVAIFGDLNTVKSVLENSTAAKTLDSELTREISAVGDKNDAWFASVSGGSNLGLIVPSPGDGRFASQAKALQSIRHASGGVLLGDTIQVSFEAITRSAEDATSLADVVRFGASFVQMQRAKDPRAALLASSLDKMTLASTGDRVNVSFAIPEQDLEQLATPQAKAASLDLGRSVR